MLSTSNPRINSIKFVGIITLVSIIYIYITPGGEKEGHHFQFQKITLQTGDSFWAFHAPNPKLVARYGSKKWHCRGVIVVSFSTTESYWVPKETELKDVFTQLFGVTFVPCSGPNLKEVNVVCAKQNGVTKYPPVQVFQCKLWMQSYGGRCPKPTMLVANTELIQKLETSKPRGVRERPLKTCRKYTDASGKQRYQGTPQLRSTQHFSCNGMFFFSFVSESFRKV